MTVYLDAGDLLVLAAAVTGGDLVVRDLGLLDAAAHRPRAAVLGVEAYQTLWLKAAALLESVVDSRPLVEGNWRLGWVAAATMCDINGWWLDADDIARLDDTPRPVTPEEIPAEASSHALDPEAARRLWDLSEKLVAA